MRRALLATACTLTLAGGSRAHAAAYTITTLVAPGAGPGGYTDPVAINNLGQVVGTADPVSHVPGPNLLVTGFLYAGGTFTTLDPPANTPYSASFQPLDINNQGQILGVATSAPGSFTPPANFVDTNGVFTPVPSSVILSTNAPITAAPPNTYTDTVFHPNGINNAGTIIGYVDREDVFSSGHPMSAGETYSNGTFTLLPGSMSPLYPLKLNDSGQFIGTAGFDNGYTRSYNVFGAVAGGPATYMTLQPPGAAAGTIRLNGLNNAGEVVGSYGTVSAQGTYAAHGFIYGNGAYTPFDIAGVTVTSLTGINDAGDLIGTYADPQGHIDAFLALPVSVPEPASLALLATALAGLTLAARRRPRA